MGKKRREQGEYQVPNQRTTISAALSRYFQIEQMAFSSEKEIQKDVKKKRTIEKRKRLSFNNRRFPISAALSRYSPRLNRWLEKRIYTTKRTFLK